MFYSRESLSHELSETLTTKFHQNYGVDNSTTFAVDHLQIRYLITSERSEDLQLWVNQYKRKIRHKMRNLVITYSIACYFCRGHVAPRGQNP